MVAQTEMMVWLMKDIKANASPDDKFHGIKISDGYDIVVTMESGLYFKADLKTGKIVMKKSWRSSKVVELDGVKEDL